MLGAAVLKAVGGLRSRQERGASSSTAEGGDSEGRDGPEPVTLRWCSVTCTLTDKKAGVKRELLSLDGGAAKPGRLLAIMGPSGSGVPSTPPLTTLQELPSRCRAGWLVMSYRLKGSIK